MASRSRKKPAVWVAVWAQILTQFGGQMATTRTKGQQATDMLNSYVETELHLPPYTVREVLCKVDQVSSKSPQFPRPREPEEKGMMTASGLTSIENAVCSGPISRRFRLLRNHLSLGHGAAITNSSVATMEQMEMGVETVASETSPLHGFN